MATRLQMQKEAISVLAALNSAIEKRVAAKTFLQELVEAIAESFEVEAVALEVSLDKEDAEPQIFEAGSDDSRKLLRRLRGEKVEKLSDMFRESIGFRTDRLSFSIRRKPPLTFKAFRILSEEQKVGQLSLLVKEKRGRAELVEEFASLLCSQLSLLWPTIQGAEVKKPAKPSLYEQFRRVGLDPQQLLLKLEEQIKESLRPELMIVAFAPEGQEHLRTLVRPQALLEGKPLLRSLPRDDTSFGEVLLSGNSVVRSYTKETISRIDDKLLADTGLRCALIVPVIFQGKVTALLFVGSKAVEEYLEEDARHLEAIAGEVAEVIDNVVSFVILKDSLEELKRRHQDALRDQRMQSISETVVTINHEVNNPLTAILGNTQLLLLKSETLDPGLVEKLRLIERNCLRIREVTQKLMAMTEPKASSYTHGRRMVDIAESSPPKNKTGE